MQCLCIKRRPATSKYGAGTESPSDEEQGSPSKPSASSAAATKRPSDSRDDTPAYWVPSNMAVQVGNDPKLRSVSTLQPGDRIRGLDIQGRGLLVWVSVKAVKNNPVMPVSASSGEGAVGTSLVCIDLQDVNGPALILHSEQPVLIRDQRKKSVAPRLARRLQISSDAIYAFGADQLALPGREVKQLLKVESIRLRRDTGGCIAGTPGATLIHLEVSSVAHALLMAPSIESPVLLVVCCQKASTKIRSLKRNPASHHKLRGPKDGDDDDLIGGTVWSFSDSDLPCARAAVEAHLKYKGRSQSSSVSGGTGSSGASRTDTSTTLSQLSTSFNTSQSRPPASVSDTTRSNQSASSRSNSGSGSDQKDKDRDSGSGSILDCGPKDRSREDKPEGLSPGLAPEAGSKPRVLGPRNTDNLELGKRSTSKNVSDANKDSESLGGRSNQTVRDQYEARNVSVKHCRKCANYNRLALDLHKSGKDKSKKKDLYMRSCYHATRLSSRMRQDICPEISEL